MAIEIDAVEQGYKQIIRSLEDQILKNKALLAEHYLQQFTGLHGVEIGDILVDHDGLEYKLSGLASDYATKDPLLRGYKRNKNGEWSKSLNYIYGIYHDGKLVKAETNESV